MCDVPAYWDTRLTAARAVSLTVRSGDRESDAVPFAYSAVTPAVAVSSGSGAAAPATDSCGECLDSPPGLLPQRGRVAPSSAEGL